MSTVVDLGSLGSSGFVVQGDSTGDFAGWRVSNAGDVNGDGFDDIIIGAPYNDLGGSNAGSAYVIYGHLGGFGAIDLSNLSAADGFRVQGDLSHDFAGLGVSAAGDVNGDGFDDIIVAADRIVGQFGYGDTPLSYVIFGKATEPGTIDLSNLTSSDGFRISGPFDFAYYGVLSASVSDAGDVNGDGFDDVIIGTQYGHNGTGAAYVVYGKANGFGAIDLATLAAADGFAILGAAANDAAGLSVASAGDINGDGLNDLVVGAPFADGGAGKAYVIFGRADGFSTIDLANLPASTGFVIQGAAAHGNTGFSVSGAGDVNGDGFDDLVVAAPFGGAGEAYVIFGKASGFGTVDLANLGAGGFMIQGEAAADQAGFSVSSAGDVNHDGFDDLIIGANGSDAGGTDAGRAYVIFGKAAGFGTIDLTNLDPSAGFVIQGASAGDNVGWSVSGAGDFNHDGAADLVIGAPFGVLGSANAGQAYVVFGSAALVQYDVRNDFNGDGRSDILLRNDDGTLVDALGQPNGRLISNASNSSVNPGLDWHVAGSGDFNGDGYDDILWRSDSGAVVDLLGQPSGGFVGNVNLNLNPGLDWHIAGTGDFNGDGRDDILWRSDSGTVIDLLGNADGSFTGNVNFNLNPGPDWHIVGTGDFNGDGKDDILWRSDSGAVVDLLGNANGSFTGNVNFSLNPGVDWHVEGTGDFNGDGYDDILWRSDSGTVVDLLGNANGSFTGNVNFNLNPGLDWHILGTGDYNGDGRDDILWRSDSGTMTDLLGQANGAFVGNVANFATNPGADWHVEPQPTFV